MRTTVLYPRLGGYVLFGNNAATIERAVASLQQVCDHVVAIDSNATDGSSEIVDRLGVERIPFAWRGFGAARRRACEALAGFDYVTFLDSDESFAPGSLETFRRWRQTHPDAAAYSVVRRDWVWEENVKYVFRAERRKRLIRLDHATWRDSMIVHEALPGSAVPLNLTVDHLFTTDRENRLERNTLYALLWAVMSHSEQRRFKRPFNQRWAHFLRNLILKGAVFRGGSHAIRLAREVAEYHAQKYTFLKEIENGGYLDLVSAYDGGHYDQVFADARRHLSS